jgi:hypothetical protein
MSRAAALLRVRDAAPKPDEPCARARAGVSLRTQELYALVFVCRYLDLFFTFISLCAPACASRLAGPSS